MMAGLTNRLFVLAGADWRRRKLTNVDGRAHEVEFVDYH